MEWKKQGKVTHLEHPGSVGQPTVRQPRTGHSLGLMMLLQRPGLKPKDGHKELTPWSDCLTWSQPQFHPQVWWCMPVSPARDRRTRPVRWLSQQRLPLKPEDLSLSSGTHSEREPAPKSCPRVARHTPWYMHAHTHTSRTLRICSLKEPKWN